MDLIARTKNAVRDLDNLNYRKMKKILMNEMVETESTIGADIEDDVSSIQDNDNEGSSKSNSINSEHSLHSQGVTSSAGSSTNSLPVPAGAEALHDLNHHSHSPLQYALHNSHSRNKQSQSQVSISAIVKSVSQTLISRSILASWRSVPTSTLTRPQWTRRTLPRSGRPR